MDDDWENEQTPQYFDLLSKEDKEEYEELRSIFTSPDRRYNRNKRIVTFTDMLQQIKAFCEKK